MESGDFSIIDLKLVLTEDYAKYAEYDHPNKLTSNGDKYYLNIQGLRFLNMEREQYFYNKNGVKYESLMMQKQMIRKMFTRVEDVGEVQSMLGNHDNDEIEKQNMRVNKHRIKKTNNDELDNQNIEENKQNMKASCEFKKQNICVNKQNIQKKKNYELDIQSIKVIKEQVKVLRSILDEYGITLESSSVLILYDEVSKQIKVKFLDFSYIPEPKYENAYLGLDIFNNILGELIK